MTRKTCRLIHWQRRTILVLLCGLVAVAFYARYQYYQNTDIPAHLSNALASAQKELTMDARLIHDQNALLKRYRAKYGALKSAPSPLIWTKPALTEPSCIVFVGTPRSEVKHSDAFGAIRYNITYGGWEDKRGSFCELSALVENPVRTEITITREYGTIREGIKALKRRAEELYPLVPSDQNEGT